MQNWKNMDISKHDNEINRNLVSWEKKPLLRDIYKTFHKLIVKYLSHGIDSYSVELGSGIGNIQEVIPNCIRTDLFPNSWIDQVENVYHLSFSDNSVDNLILIDVFHHLRYPGTCLKEFHRVIAPNGRILIFEPCMSMLGLMVYGLFHQEELGLGNEIQMFAPKEWSFNEECYYAAQGNASRIFFDKKYKLFLENWSVITRQRLSAISYVTSGGYSMPQLYPAKALPLMKFVDRICDLFPIIFATRLLVVLEKKMFAGQSVTLDGSFDELHCHR
jgi:hypothetical protein